MEELEQQLRETTARIRAIDQALADPREEYWWQNERATLQAEKIGLQAEKVALYEEKIELLRKENRLEEGIRTSASRAFIAPVEYNPATYSVIDRLQKNGLHLSLIERAQQLQLIRECFGTSQKINVAVLCASRGMGKTALLRALADPESYESRKIPKIARAHKVGRVIPVDLSQMLKIDQPGEIEKYMRDSTLIWVEIIQRHLLLLFHGCTVDGILFKESSKTFIEWCAEFRKLDLLAKELSRLTQIAFPEADDDCKAAGPVFLLDEIAVFLHDTGALSTNLKDGAKLKHTLLSEALGRISAVPGAAVIVAGTKDGRLGLLSKYSQFIATDVPLACFSDDGCREYCTAYILKYNLTKQPAHAIPAPDFEDATGILPLMLLLSYNIPRFLAISMELYCDEMSTEPNYKFSYDFHAAVLRAIRRHYQDASLALAHLGTDSLTLLTLACASGYPLNDVDMKIGNIPVRDLVDRCIIFRGIANKYVLPVQMLFDPNSRYQNKVSEQAKEWIPGLDIERCFFHFNKWVNNAIKNTGGIYFEDVILQSLAARIFVFKRLHCQYPNSPNLVAFPEVYDCLPGSDSQQITSSWMIYTNDVSFCADKDIPAPRVPPVSATASGKVYHTKPLPNARFDGALESPIPTYIQAKYSTKIIWTDVAMQIKNLPANGRLLWIMPTINEDYILDFSQLSKNKEVIEGAYATGRLAFVSGSGALSPYTFSAMKLLKYFDVPKSHSVIDQALADSREYWWQNERATLQAEKIGLQAEKVELLRKENRLDEAVKTSASSAFIAPVEYNPATYSVIDRLQKNGLHLSLIERAQQLQLIRECFGTSQKINVAVLCASRGMGKTALLRALADPERYESRKIPKIARAHKVGRVIPVDLSQMLKIDQPGEIEKYIRDSTLLWVEIIQRHLLLLFHGCTVDGILFKESSKTFIKWCAEFRKLDLLAKEWSRLTKIAFPEADDDCKAAGPVFLLDEIAVFLHETGALSTNLKDGARLEHTLLSEALGRISAVPGAAVIVAGTKDGRLGLLSQYSQFIATDVPLTCFSDAGCREYCTAYILKYNLTKKPAHAIPAPDFEDATGILPLMLLLSYNIPRFLAISMELYCDEMSKESNYKFSYEFHAVVLRAIRRHYQDASLALAHLGTDSLTLLTLACASGYPLNDVDINIGNIPVRDLVDRCIIFRGIANKYVLPVPMLFDPNSHYQNEVSERAKEWIPGLDIERCFFHFNKWMNNAAKNTGGVYFEDVILQSLAARIFVFKQLHCKYPNSPNLVAFPEVYDCLPGSDSQQITSSWMIYTNDISFCADKDIPAPHVPPVSATASGKVYHTKPLPNARFDGALESPIPTYIQAKYSTKIIWTDVAMQIKNLPANGRLLWIMPTINEDYILDFSQLSKNKEVVEGAYATGRLAFVSGSGALSPYTFSAMKLLKYFDVPK
ncbi:hypothetical protein HK098_004460 [Nowakowskiella sp. JEL0407]|nr:hypothetical protein HK098_004460 [Nowakowskiella sp. JEL0407]